MEFGCMWLHLAPLTAIVDMIEVARIFEPPYNFEIAVEAFAMMWKCSMDS